MDTLGLYCVGASWVRAECMHEGEEQSVHVAGV